LRSAACRLPRPVLCLAVCLAVCVEMGGCSSLEPPGASLTTGRSSEAPATTVVGPNGLGVTLVRARLTGRSAARERWLVLDSGSQSLVVPRRLVDELSLPLLGKGLVNRGAEVSFHEAATVEVGPIVLRRPVVTAVEREALGPLGELFGGEIGGLAGYPLFAGAVVEVRYGAGGEGDRVSIHEPGAYRLPAGTTWYPVSLVAERPVVEGHLADGRAVALMIDTGTSGALALARELVETTGLVDGRTAKAERRLTLHGEVEVGVARLPSLELAGRSFENVPLTIQSADPGDRVALPTGAAGLVGRQLFAGLTLVLDYPNRRFAVLDPLTPVAAPGSDRASPPAGTAAPRPPDRSPH